MVGALVSPVPRPISFDPGDRSTADVGQRRLWVAKQRSLVSTDCARLKLAMPVAIQPRAVCLGIERDATSALSLRWIPLLTADWLK